MDAAEVPSKMLNGCAGLKKRSEKKLSKEQILEIESMINADRRKLEEQKDMEVEQRDKIKVLIYLLFMHASHKST